MHLVKKLYWGAWFFFANYFYGICVLALALEAALQQQLPLCSWPFYLLLACSTVFYYTQAYTGEIPLVNNERSFWYRKHAGLIFWHNVALLIGITIALLFIVYFNWGCWQYLNAYTLFLLLFFPLLAILYYGVTIGSYRFNLRGIGWVKPFVIAAVWTATVSIYPLVFQGLVHGRPYLPTAFAWVLMCKNFMFIAVVGIMFDIKDYAADHNRQLKTFVVKSGLRHTIFYILIPLSSIGLGTFLIYGLFHAFSATWMILNTIPFIALIVVAFSLRKRRSILYYLVIIDGLLLLKALCGIVAVWLVV